MTTPKGSTHRQTSSAAGVGLLARNRPTLVREFTTAAKPFELANSPQSKSFRRELESALRCALEAVPYPHLRAIPFEGFLFLAVEAFNRRPTAADIILVYTGEAVPDFIQLPDGRCAEFMAGFSYSLMELTEEGEVQREVPASDHPNLRRFLGLEREEMAALLVRYALPQAVDRLDLQ